MSDLISRSELLKRFLVNKDGHRIPERDCDNLEVTVSIKDVKTIIKEQPTAYSVDGVVEELKERADFLKDCTKYGNKNAKQQAESYNTMMMYEVADLVDDLIEIVKNGGVDDDLCEWRLIKGYKFLHKTSCGDVFDMQNGFKYCPFCGKKIKVVE